MNETTPAMPDWIIRMTSNEIRALAAREFPNASIRLLGGAEFWFFDLIKAAEAREDANDKP